MRSARLAKKPRSRGPLSQLFTTRKPLIAKKISTPKKPNECAADLRLARRGEHERVREQDERGGAQAQQVEASCGARSRRARARVRGTACRPRPVSASAAADDHAATRGPRRRARAPGWRRSAAATRCSATNAGRSASAAGPAASAALHRGRQVLARARRAATRGSTPAMPGSVDGGDGASAREVLVELQRAHRLGHRGCATCGIRQASAAATRPVELAPRDARVDLARWAAPRAARSGRARSARRRA